MSSSNTRSRLLSSLRLFIINAKIESEELDKLREIIDSNGGDLVSSVTDAEVILTRIHVKKRLERHIGEEDAKSKAIVTPEWLTESLARGKPLPYHLYTAVRSLRPSTDSGHPPVQVQTQLQTQGQIPAQPTASSSTALQTQTVPPKQFHRLSVWRRSPLVCLNQALVAELNVIKKARWLDGDDRSALSYSRSISVLKAYPKEIRSGQEAAPLPGVGPKIVKMVDEFLKTGQIEEARRLANSQRLKMLDEFAAIYGIGPSSARELYDMKGVRTMEDLERFAGLYDQGPPDAASLAPARQALRHALLLREDLAKKIPRAEVERMAEVIFEHLEAIQPGCQYTICGGYRRGKPESNDVDIIYTHPDNNKAKGLCAKLVQRLQKAGIVNHILHMSSFGSGHEGPRGRHFGGSSLKGKMDSLDKALTVVQIPPEGSTAGPSTSYPRPAIRKAVSDSSEDDALDDNVPIAHIPPGTTHRRLDIIFAPLEQYYTAIVGWTGSTQFMRDIRIWSKENKGYNFDSSGITRLRDTRAIPTHSEQEVFEVLGLEYVEPEWRNADA